MQGVINAGICVAACFVPVIAAFFLSRARLRRFLTAQGYTLVSYTTMNAYYHDKSPNWIDVFYVVATKDGVEYKGSVKMNNFFFIPGTPVAKLARSDESPL